MLAAMAAAVPDRQAFLALARRGSIVPVYREVLADGDTPVSAYAKLTAGGAGKGSFLLESVVGGQKWGAYSFIGVRPRAIIRGRGGVLEVDTLLEPSLPVEVPAGLDPAAALGAILAAYRPAAPPGLPRFFGGAVGYLAYDMVRDFERLPNVGKEELGLPDCLFVLTDTLVIFDNLRQTLKLVATACTPEGASDRELGRAYDAALSRIDGLERALGEPAPRLSRLDLDVVTRGERVRLDSAFEKSKFIAAVGRIKEYILSGDAFQVVLSQRFEADRAGLDPFDVYRALRVINPSPYMFHLDYPEVTVTGASPEVLCRLEGGVVDLRPIAGTRRRGRDEAEDARLEAELRADPKERAEHVMLVDLGRNDVGRVAKLGSVRVVEQMVVERYSHVMHLVSHVRGELAAGKNAIDVLRAAFPAGTLTGAPKIRAMEIIEELEPTRRGIYGGAVGYLSYSGNMDLAIAIRTLVSRGDRFFVQAGAGVVHDSDAEAEYAECVNKASAVASALALAQGADRGGAP
jgi:anthranilate synthase component 1